MELKEFAYIVAIAEEGSISKASERLFLAQSSLSQFLSRLEAELGVKLFSRTASGVRPTLAGEIYIRNARQVLKQMNLVETELRDITRPSEGRIRFGISSYRGSYLLPKVMSRFREIAPAVEVIFYEMDSIHLQRKIAAGELDMALIAFHEGQWNGQGKRIKRDEVVIVANKEHPVMQYVKIGQGGPPRPWVELREILHFEFLLSNPSTILGSCAKTMFDAIGKSPRVLNGNLTAAFAASMAKQGLGLAFTYRSCAEADPRVEYLSIGARQPYVNLALLYPPEGYRSRAIHTLEETIRQCLSEDGM